jgi:putative zinc finger/helix-turn-helix YgiT family protein
MEKSYCSACEKEQLFQTINKNASFNVRNVLVSAIIEIRLCSVCGNELFDEELEQKNEKIVFSSYRHMMNLLNPEEIKAIRDKYGLSQQLFSRLLGFGDKTIARYESGSIQDLSHDLLIRLANDRSCFALMFTLMMPVFTPKQVAKIKTELLVKKDENEFRMSI